MRMPETTANLVVEFLQESTTPLSFVAGSLLAEEDPVLTAMGREVNAVLQCLTDIRHRFEMAVGKAKRGGD